MHLTFAVVFVLIILTISIPIAFLTTCLIAMLWGELLHSVAVRSSFLTDKKWQVAVVVIVLFAGDLVNSILSGLYVPAITMRLISSFFMVLAQLCIGIYFLVKGFHVLRVLQVGLDAFRRNRDQRKGIQRMTKRLVVSGIGMLIFVIGAAGGGTPLYRASPRYFIGILTVVFVGVQITSLAQIMAIFKPPKPKVTPFPGTNVMSKRADSSIVAEPMCYNTIPVPIIPS